MEKALNIDTVSVQIAHSRFGIEISAEPNRSAVAPDSAITDDGVLAPWEPGP